MSFQLGLWNGRADDPLQGWIRLLLIIKFDHEETLKTVHLDSTAVCKLVNGPCIRWYIV